MTGGGISASFYKGLRGSWRRRNYERLDGSHRSHRRKNRVELDSFSSEQTAGADHHRHRRRFWRVKIKPKMRFFKGGMSSPKKFFTRLRDAYVNMMMGFANSRMSVVGYGCGGGGNAFGMGNPSLKEYDEKVIIEIYKSMMAQGYVLPCDAAKVAASTATAAAPPIACGP